MVVAILIAFHYRSLPGALHDLDHAARWCARFHCHTHILSDKFDTLVQFPDLEETTQHVVTHRKQWSNTIDKILATVSDKLVIYFSGHGREESMVLPDNTYVPFVTLRNSVSQSIPQSCEVFWILDCCNPDGMHLPFRLQQNQFRVSSRKISCVPQPMLLITSCEPHEQSVALASGSIFTRYLFQQLVKLDNSNRNLRRFMGTLASAIRTLHTGYAQTVSIYASYIMDPVLWLWIGQYRSYDIRSDISLRCLIVEHKPVLESQSALKL